MRNNLVNPRSSTYTRQEFQPVHAQFASEAEIFHLHVKISRRGKEFLLSQAQYFSEAKILHLHVSISRRGK